MAVEMSRLLVVVRVLIVLKTILVSMTIIEMTIISFDGQLCRDERALTDGRTSSHRSSKRRNNVVDFFASADLNGVGTIEA